MYSTATHRSFNPNVYLSAEQRHQILSRLKVERFEHVQEHRFDGCVAGTQWALNNATFDQLLRLTDHISDESFKRFNCLDELAQVVYGCNSTTGSCGEVLLQMLPRAQLEYLADECNHEYGRAFLESFAVAAKSCFLEVIEDLRKEAN